VSGVVAVFDAGKTNKKLLLFDEEYKVIHETSQRFEEVADEDGFPCENVESLQSWIHSELTRLLAAGQFTPTAINFTSYGASFVHLDENGKVILPLYNYLKPYPAQLASTFFNKYGGENNLSRETASPILGHLNSGLLLYRLKHEKQLLNNKGFSLHLPQYLSFLLTGKYYSDITSIGCHTMLWHFEKYRYHDWAMREGIDQRLAPVFSSDEVMDVEFNDARFLVGVGLHDSSAALIPYLASFHEPFVLISTGTWSISMNPFNHSPLTAAELKQDCLCYMTYQQKPVKSSRLFAGHMHDSAVNKIAAQFNRNNNFYEEIKYDENCVEQLKSRFKFSEDDLDVYTSCEDAYHALMIDIVRKQAESTNLVMSADVKKIFVDGGFGRNEIYMRLLADAFPLLEVYAASVPQATAMGAALAIHKHWNRREVPEGIVNVKRQTSDGRRE